MEQSVLRKVLDCTFVTGIVRCNSCGTQETRMRSIAPNVPWMTECGVLTCSCCNSQDIEVPFWWPTVDADMKVSAIMGRYWDVVTRQREN